MTRVSKDLTGGLENKITLVCLNLFHLGIFMGLPEGGLSIVAENEPRGGQVAKKANDPWAAPTTVWQHAWWDLKDVQM